MTLSGGSSFGGFSNNGNASIKNSVISGNTGSGVSNSGTLTIQNSTISGNTTPGGGGGVYNYVGTVAITNSTISDNTAKSSGGGVNNARGYYGGAGSVAITNSTISGNAANHGGAVNNSVDGSVTLTNSTITGNRADGGGGVYNDGACFHNEVGQFFCISANLTLNNSLIAGNQATVGPEIENYASSIVTANNFNLFGANGNAGVTGFSPGPTDIVPGVSLAQILGPLKNNGGPTQTLALVAGSPAIDAGNPNGCQDNSGALLQTDQRGFPRNVDGNSDGTARCDIGAVEGVGGAAVPVIDFDGDGKSDITIYRDGVWYVIRSSDGGQRSVGWGGAPQDQPVPGRLRWRRKDRHSGVPRWNVVHLAFIRWQRQGNRLGRCASGHTGTKGL